MCIFLYLTIREGNQTVVNLFLRSIHTLWIARQPLRYSRHIGLKDSMSRADIDRSVSPTYWSSVMTSSHESLGTICNDS